MLSAKVSTIYAAAGTAALLDAHGVTMEPVYCLDECPSAEIH
jgi:hypothetical protein